MPPDFSSTSYTPDNLIAGDFPLATSPETVESGAGALTRGSVMGRKTANGKLVLVDDAAADGSENIYGVLVEDVDASAADVESGVYLTGQFNEDALTFGGDDTPADHVDAARALSIFFKKPTSR